MSLPRTTLHSHVIPMGGSALGPHQAGTHSLRPPQPQSSILMREGPLGPLQPHPGRQDRVLRPQPAMAEARVLLQRCRGWREPNKSDCLRYLSQRGLKELGNCKCLIKGC